MEKYYSVQMKRVFSNVELTKLYRDEQKSASFIAQRFSCSQNKINYWLKKYKIQKRGISDALYIKHNPKGDPFVYSEPHDKESSFLLGLGLGLYWGEGNKKNKTTVRLGNTDPHLIKKFIEFLARVYHVKRKKFRFGLQIFSDMNPSAALSFWSHHLGFSRDHFGKVIVTPARSLGTYKEKTKHGVLTIYVSNRKLRDLINDQIEMLKIAG